MTSKHLIDVFVDALWVENGLSQNTLSAYASDLRIFNKSLNNKSLVETSNSDIALFLSQRYQQVFKPTLPARYQCSIIGTYPLHLTPFL